MHTREQEKKKYWRPCLKNYDNPRVSTRAELDTRAELEHTVEHHPFIRSNLPHAIDLRTFCGSNSVT